jgi:hypothetical protein
LYSIHSEFHEAVSNATASHAPHRMIENAEPPHAGESSSSQRPSHCASTVCIVVRSHSLQWARRRLSAGLMRLNVSNIQPSPMVRARARRDTRKTGAAYIFRRSQPADRTSMPTRNVLPHFN